MWCLCLHARCEYESYLWWSLNFQKSDTECVFEALPLSFVDNSKSTLRDLHHNMTYTVKLNDIAVSDEVIQHHAVMSQKESISKIREFVELVTPYNQVSTLNPINVDVTRFSLR